MIKKLLLIASLLVPTALLADTGDIPLSSNFQENSGRPLDAKIVAADATARNAIATILRYDGMLVYQRSDHHTWQLQGGTSTWVDVTSTGGGGGSVVNSTLTFVNIADSNNQIWAITVSTPGNLVTVTTTSASGVGFNAITVETATITGITSGQCLQSGTGGLITGTGSACGSGGGGSGPSGQINNGTPYQTPYYSVSGSSNVLSATSNVRVFPSSVTILGAVPIVSTGTLQSGTTIYVSSGTVAGQLTISGGANAKINVGDASGNGRVFIGDVSGATQVTELLPGDILVQDSTGNKFGELAGNLISGGDISNSSTFGINGSSLVIQVVTPTAGTVTLTPFMTAFGNTPDTSISRGSAGNVYIGTGTSSSHNGTLSSGTGIFSSTVTALSYTTSGSGTGQFISVEGTAPSGVSGSDIIYGDSTAHAWKVINNNGAVSQVVVSSITPTTGHIASWSGTGTLIDGGTGGGGSGTPGGSDTQVQYNNAGSFAGTSLETVDASSISFNNISSMTYIGFSTMVFQSGTGLDVSSGTFYLSTATFSNGSLLEVNAAGLLLTSPGIITVSTMTTSSATVTNLNAVTQNIYGNAANPTGIYFYQNGTPIEVINEAHVGDPSAITANTYYSLAISSGLNQSAAVSYITGANFNPASYRFGTSNGTSTSTMLTVSTTSISAFGGVFYSTYTNSQELVVMSTNNVSAFSVSNSGGGSTKFGPNLFSSLGTPADGTFEYCSDCTVVTPATCTANLLASCVCAGSGSGSFAKRINGTWYCE